MSTQYVIADAALKSTGLFGAIAGGKATLADTGIERYAPLVARAPGAVVAMVLAVLFVAIAVFLPRIGSR